MQNLNKFVIIFLLFGFANSLYSVDKDQIFDQVKSKFNGLNSINLKFIDAETNQKGEITAAKNNKYVINIFGRSIISNGSTIWNYSVQDSNVLISNFQSFENELSIETLFFDLLKNFYPVKITDNLSSAGNTGYRLYLKPKADYDNVHNIKSIELVVGKKNNNILEVSYLQDYAKYKWLIKDIEINPEINESTFIFQKHNNIEVIDLR